MFPPRRSSRPALDYAPVQHDPTLGVETVDEPHRSLDHRLAQTQGVVAIWVSQACSSHVEGAADDRRAKVHPAFGYADVLKFDIAVDGGALGRDQRLALRLAPRRPAKAEVPMYVGPAELQCPLSNEIRHAREAGTQFGIGHVQRHAAVIRGEAPDGTQVLRAIDLRDPEVVEMLQKVNTKVEVEAVFAKKGFNY